MEGDNSADNRSITCFKLPEMFVLDKQETKRYFSQYGVVKSFILRPNRKEATIEYETAEAAQRALSSNADLEIVPTKPEHLQKVNDDYIDPDVQSELQAMLPSSIKNTRPSMESIMKNPFKTKMYPSPKHKTEPLAVSVNSEQSRLIQNAKTELENLTKKPAFTAEEKFAVLDARDKLYRVMNAKPTDIKNAFSTRGTCKDMCPEKERLMRISRLQVSSFEMDDESNIMDPKKAIKQYSRSSADQEIPLPHELRSEETLKATMTYLLYDIINLCDNEDVSVGDWYHFVWDRTRGIRKDITQQELCSLNTVELLEQCARFHIHCSARLVAEDPSTFDQKINDENLTKSLQTLKYMYDDLKLKNIKCPNEAEFRGYVVLLNLNESGNFLWEIKRLEKDLLNSHEMRFALEVYFSVALNNYVKFFNLVREASYMNACILLKYFTQIRLKAIFTIMRSYTQKRGAKFAFNLSYLTEILNFESDEATANFMTYYGGMCDLDNDIIVFDPTTFANVQTPYQMERALEAVEYKLEGSVAEAICGNELPSPDCFLKIEPHNSFDSNGFLKKEAFYVEDQNGPINKDGIFKVPKESPPVSPSSKLFSQTKNVFGRTDQTDGNSIFASVPFSKTATSTPFNSLSSFSPFSLPATAPKPIPNLFTSPSANIFGQQPTFNSPETVRMPKFDSAIFGRPIRSQESPKSVVSSTFTPAASPAFSTSSTVSSSPSQSDQDLGLLQEKIKAEQERLKRESEAAEMMLRKKLAEKAQQEQEKREAQERQERERKEQEERLKREAEERRLKKLQQDSEDIFEELLDEVIAEKLTHEASISKMLYEQIPRDFYDALEYDVVVEKLIDIYEQEQLSYINSMKRMYQTLYRNFDHWRKITMKEKEKREKLSNIGCSALNKSLEDHSNAIIHPQQNVTLSNMKQYLSGSPLQVTVPNFNVYNTIDLFSDLYSPPSKLPSKLFWKIVFSVPLKNEEKCVGFSSFIKKWLGKMFNSDEEQNIFLLKRGNIHHSQVSICLRKVQGIEVLNEKLVKDSNSPANANSLVFFCTTVALNESRMRLNNILDKINNSVSVTIIVYKNVIEYNDEDLIRTYFDLSMEPKVNNFEISLFYECKEKNKDLRLVMIEGCQFLYDNYLHQLNTEYSKMYELEMQQVIDFFQCYFGDEMWQRIEMSWWDNKDFKARMSSFNNVIQLYNLCIDKMVGIISSDYKKLPILPEEFRALLPVMEIRIPHSFEYFPSNWNQQTEQKKMISFLRDLKLKQMPNDKFENFNDFQDKVRSFLNENISSAYSTQVFHTLINKIVQHFYQMQLKTTEKMDNVIDKMRWLNIFECIVVGKFNEMYQLKKQDLPNFVIYSRKDIRNYTVPWWYVCHLSSTVETEIEPSSKKTKYMQSANYHDIDSVLKKGRESLMKASDLIKNSQENRAKTREDSKSFDQYLHKCEEKFRGMKRSLQDKFKD